MVVGRRRRKRKVATGTLRRIAVALAALLLSFAVLSGAARARNRYFYCEAMGLMETDPCAAAAQSDGTRDGAPWTEAREGHTDCCEVVTLSAMPAGTSIVAQSVPPPGLVALLPAAIFGSGSLSAPSTRPDRSFQRWRVPPRYPGELRAQLMVFLT